ncbi:hypothetical protein T10_13249, partial [Trichinella papuae]
LCSSSNRRIVFSIDARYSHIHYILVTRMTAEQTASAQQRFCFDTFNLPCQRSGILTVVTVGLSESQRSLVSRFFPKNNSWRIPDHQFGMCGLPVLRLVVLGPEQFGVYGSSVAQPGFFKLSCKE